MKFPRHERQEFPYLKSPVHVKRYPTQCETKIFQNILGKSKPLNFFPETKSEKFKVRMTWIFLRAILDARQRRTTPKILRENNMQSRILLPAKVLFKCKGENKDRLKKRPTKHPSTANWWMCSSKLRGQTKKEEDMESEKWTPTEESTKGRFWLRTP